MNEPRARQGRQLAFDLGDGHAAPPAAVSLPPQPAPAAEPTGGGASRNPVCKPNEERVVLELGGRVLPLLLQRSRQARRISLRVRTERREVVLVVPLRGSIRTAMEFARKNVAWIADRIERMPQASPFVDGGEVPLRGVPHRIRHRPDRRGTVWLENGEIHVAGDISHLRRRLLEWLKRQAGREVTPLVHAKAARLAATGRGRKVRGVTIRDTVSRWGSCGSDGSVMVSWRMILAPPAILDYLVAHEVAHLAEQNHSTRFWEVCAELTDGPIEAAEAWLKAHGARLLQYGARGKQAG